jgi:hypothetical protein
MGQLVLMLPLLLPQGPPLVLQPRLAFGCVMVRLAPACGALQPALSCGQPQLLAQPAAYWDQSRPVSACRSTGLAFLFYRYRHSF